MKIHEIDDDDLLAYCEQVLKQGVEAMSSHPKFASRVEAIHWAGEEKKLALIMRALDLRGEKYAGRTARAIQRVDLFCSGDNARTDHTYLAQLPKKVVRMALSA